jgi:hypothetical protein
VGGRARSAHALYEFPGLDRPEMLIGLFGGSDPAVDDAIDLLEKSLAYGLLELPFALEGSSH